MVEGFRGFQSSYGSNNLYSTGRQVLPQLRPFVPYQGNNINQIRQPYQSFRPPQQQQNQQQNPPPIRPSLQITNGAANANQFPGQRNFINQYQN